MIDQPKRRLTEQPSLFPRFWVRYDTMLAILWLVLLYISQYDLSRAQTPRGADPIFVGAGDIAVCDSDHDEATATLLDGIAGTIFTLGDNVYDDGKATEFTSCFNPTWGRHKARIKPAPGNHDYHTNGAAGYYSYFGATASPLDENCTSDCKGYYSYDLGEWHIIALNSEIGVKAGSEQEQWLRQDLAAHPTACTLAYWHKPRFSSGSHQNDTAYHAFWTALYEAGVDIVLNGHDHDYERFALQNPDGTAEPNRGIRQFVVGTGGVDQTAFGRIQPNSEVRATGTWGVLQLTLRASSYDWEFVPIAGQSFRDTGSTPCVVLDQSQIRITRRVAQSADDAEEGEATAPVNLTSTDLEVTVDPLLPLVNQTVGVRFSDLPISTELTITRAYLEFTVDEKNTESTSVQIAGEATDNALLFTAASANISQRTRTATVVPWESIGAWSTVGAKQRTPDITPIIQEIINRPGWTPGNALAFIITGGGRRTAVAFDGNPTDAPLLHIEYDRASLTHDLYLPVIQQNAQANHSTQRVPDRFHR